VSEEAAQHSLELTALSRAEIKADFVSELVFN